MIASYIQSASNRCAIASSHYEALRIVVVRKNSCERSVSSAIPVEHLPPLIRSVVKSHIERFLTEIDFAIRDAKSVSKMQASFAPPDFTY